MAYYPFRDEESDEESGSCEVFELDAQTIAREKLADEEGDALAPGWFWHACFPGCMPDGDMSGPFESKWDALEDAGCVDLSDGARFDRFDICEAHACLEWDYNTDGIVWERPSNKRRCMSTDVQLSRMKFRPRPNLSFDTLEENGARIYRELERRYGFRK